MCESHSGLSCDSLRDKCVQDLAVEKTCSVEGCGSKVHSLGLCGKHYRAHWRKRKNSSDTPQAQCCSCGGFFTPNRFGQKFCSHTCSARDRRGCKAREESRSYVCAHCGKEYESASVKETIYCSRVCKLAAWRKANPEEYRVHQAICRRVREARLRTATVEKVDPYKVFTRDKWTCQECGVSTPRSKRGSYDDDAPELDHIKPLSKGGDHSYSNTQCLCRRCNQEKSDTWQPQEGKSLLQA